MFNFCFILSIIDFLLNCLKVTLCTTEFVFFSELRLQPKTTTIDPHVYTTAKPRRKQQPSYNKGLNEVVRAKETHFSNQMHQENALFVGGIGVSQRAKSGISDGTVESGNVMIKEAEGKL